VRITLDGTRAHVEFSADLAATRAAIESSLPELAASLRDSGLTLAGGGVFDQRRGRGEQAPGGQPGGMRNGGADALDEGLPTIAATQAPARSTRGVVDLLA
jgi:flagellar hook-length control protein FliK